MQRITERNSAGLVRVWDAESVFKLALVEDDDAVRDALTLGMVNRGYLVHAYASGDVAVQSISVENTDVALVDLMLPGIDGIDVCRALRTEFPAMSLVVLTARAGDADMVDAFAAGADDYIVKPAEPGVIDARMRAVLLRNPVRDTAKTHAATVSTIGDLTVDTAALTVHRGDVEIALTATEIRLFLHLYAHRGVVLSRQQLLNEVWDYAFAGEERLVDTTVQRLRAKVEKDPKNPSLICTVRGFGYRFSA